MTGFDPRSSGIGSNRPVNCATTTDQSLKVFITVNDDSVAHLINALMILFYNSIVVLTR